MSSTLQPDELKAKQEEFVKSFDQWRSFVYQLLIAKGIKNTIRHPRQKEEMVDRFQGHLWAVYDRFDPDRASFSTWLNVEFLAFWSARARAQKMGRSLDGEDVGRVRRKGRHNSRPNEPHRARSMDLVAVGLPSQENKEQGELSEEGFHRYKRPGHLPSAEVVLSLRDCVARLSEQDQELLRTVEAHDGSVRSLAVSMGLIPQTLESRIKQIYRDLRSLMKTGQPARGAAKRNKKPINPHRYARYSNDEWREYFKTELVFYDHIYCQLYPEAS